MPDKPKPRLLVVPGDAPHAIGRKPAKSLAEYAAQAAVGVMGRQAGGCSFCGCKDVRRRDGRTVCRNCGRGVGRG